MANLTVRNIDDAIADALKESARLHGVSAEAEHRRILAEALTRPPRKRFEQVLAEMPDVGEDADFARGQDDAVADVFD